MLPIMAKLADYVCVCILRKLENCAGSLGLGILPGVKWYVPPRENWMKNISHRTAVGGGKD